MTATSCFLKLVFNYVMDHASAYWSVSNYQTEIARS